MNKTAASAVQDLSNPNLFRNGCCSVWQHGTNFDNPDGKFVMDGWREGSDGAVNIARVARTNTQPFTAISFNPKGTKQYLSISQRLEAQSVAHLLGKKATVSFDYFIPSDSEVDSVYVHILTPNAFENFSSVTSRQLVYEQSVTKGKWSRAVITLDINFSDILSGAMVYLVFHCKTGNISTGKIHYMANLKLEGGDVATPFVPDHPQVNLDKCHRYYFKINGEFVDTVGSIYNPITKIRYSHHIHYFLPSPMRVPLHQCSVDYLLKIAAINVNVTHHYTFTHGHTVENYQRFGVRNGAGSYTDEGDLFLSMTVDAEL
ncbi:hypothetical protein [Vibrio europaeus]|uniref:hypothetical protein n=1 Tax=Vibrio europaeus TaxID=300876 RepID=UPI00233EF8F1|nr:hypothetical protein [Vibrio europaeus]MDC5753525.1 hypothetical protein [Vibrio europaeus]MDC5816562.1 hypothetical protein [Vibrio europaeus]